MFDELNQSTEQEQVVEQPEQKTADEISKQESLRVLRERADAAERRNRELEHMIQMNMSQQQTSKMQIVEDNDDFDISDDTYVEGKHLKKYLKNLKQENKKTKQQFEEYIQQSSLNNAEMRLKSQFSDFESVVNATTLEKLQQQKPALYRMILANPDVYDKGYTAYELIKNSGIVDNKYADIDRRVEDNKSKPRSSSNASPQTGDTPLARVGDFDRRTLTDARRDEILRQSIEYARNG